MWTFISAFFTGPLTNISNDIKEAYQSKLKAANDAERIAADERITILEAQESIIRAAQSDPYERWVRIFLAIPVIVYVNKLLIWDKVLKLGVTDPLSTELQQFFWVVVGGFFLDATATRIARISNARRK